MMSLISDQLEKKRYKKARSVAERAEKLATQMMRLSDEELRDAHWRLRHRNIAIRPHEVPQAMAIFSEIAFRAINLRPHRTQNATAFLLYSGVIAEMATGEGKTLAAMMAAYLAVLSSGKVHIITANDYLAHRDMLLAKRVFDLLDLHINFVSNDDNPEDKVAAYRDSDILYATASTVGFDYLRSNIAPSLQHKILNGLHDRFAIVDEVDSILIDEARNPLVLTGEGESVSRDMLEVVVDIAGRMKGVTISCDEAPSTTLDRIQGDDLESYPDHDYVADRSNGAVTLNEVGYRTFERLAVEHGVVDSSNELYMPESTILYTLETCLKALLLYTAGVDYLVEGEKREVSEIRLIDPGTGRAMPGRVLEGGLHQAIEIKERVPLTPRYETLGEIAYQNLFALYSGVVGMTGTAHESRQEFEDVYGLQVCRVPTFMPTIRLDREDVFFPNKSAKLDYLINAVHESHSRCQPVLVGTNSINDSEEVAERLRQTGIQCQVLNARNHSRESKIIAGAGRPGAVTIATSMAGRGTDITLGGSKNSPEFHDCENICLESEINWQSDRQKVVVAGGLRVIGFERNFSRRIDNQLRGRSGRQGEPGESLFLVSLDDDLIRMNVDEKRIDTIRKVMFPGNTPSIEGMKMLTRTVLRAQRQAANRDFSSRVAMLAFDNILDDQRRTFYAVRDRLLTMSNGRIDPSTGDYISPMGADINGEVEYFSDTIVPNPLPENSEENLQAAKTCALKVKDVVGLDIDPETIHAKTFMDGIPFNKAIADSISTGLSDIRKEISSIAFYVFLKQEKLSCLDSAWRHLLERSGQIRKEVQIRAYAQKKPIDEYRHDMWQLFNDKVMKYTTIDAIRNIIKNSRQSGP